MNSLQRYVLGLSRVLVAIIFLMNGLAIVSQAQAIKDRYLGNQGYLEIRWAPARRIIVAFNFAGFEPGTFFNGLAYNAGPIAANAGLTYRF